VGAASLFCLFLFLPITRGKPLAAMSRSAACPGLWAATSQSALCDAFPVCAPCGFAAACLLHCSLGPSHPRTPSSPHHILSRPPAPPPRFATCCVRHWTCAAAGSSARSTAPSSWRTCPRR
jgi:hypothetical protein